MQPCRKQPYYNYAIEKLPDHSRIENAVAEYLGYRLDRDPNLSIKVWEACIDEIVSGLKIKKLKRKGDTGLNAKNQRLIGSSSDNPDRLINDIVYMFQLATIRGWNHVYFTKDQDASWSNVSFYQDPWWSKIKLKCEKELEEILNGE